MEFLALIISIALCGRTAWVMDGITPISRKDAIFYAIIFYLGIGAFALAISLLAEKLN